MDYDYGKYEEKGCGTEIKKVEKGRRIILHYTK